MFFAASIEHLKNLKYHTSYKNINSFYCLMKCNNDDEKVFKEEESIEIYKIFGFIENT